MALLYHSVMLIFLQANESLIARRFPPCLFNKLFGYQKSIKLWSTFSSLSTHFFSSTQTKYEEERKKADSRFVTHKALIHHAHIFTQLNTKLWWWREEIFLFILNKIRAPLKGKNFFSLYRHTTFFFHFCSRAAQDEGSKMVLYKYNQTVGASF